MDDLFNFFLNSIDFNPHIVDTCKFGKTVKSDFFETISGFPCNIQWSKTKEYYAEYQIYKGFKGKDEKMLLNLATSF